MIEKRYYLYRIFEDEGKLENYTECSYLEASDLVNLKRKLINTELFGYECFPEDWEALEKKLGITRSEMIDMDFMEILDRLHHMYFLVLEYKYVKTGTSYGPAIPYND